MKLQQRIYLLIRLGVYIKNSDDFFELVKNRAGVQNPWFITHFINLALENIADNFLQQGKLEEWVRQYKVAEDNNADKTIGIVMAGNIPMVGFHDLLCVLISGNKVIAKCAKGDAVLIPFLLDKLKEIDSQFLGQTEFVERLENINAQNILCC